MGVCVFLQLIKYQCNIILTYRSHQLVNNRYAYTLNDQQVVAQILSGDINAYAQLVKRTEGLVTQMIFKMINNPSDRKDLAQDIYIKVYKNLGDFKFQARLSTWIGQITYNTCLHYLSKKRPVLLNAYLDADADEQRSLERLQQKTQDIHSNETESIIFGKQASSILHSEIGRLPPMQKLIITLFHAEELSYQEISEITGLPDGTIKSHLFRARKTLKTNILTNYTREDL